MSGDHGAEQPARQDIRSDRDAYAAGRDLTINNFFDRSERDSADSATSVSGKPVVVSSGAAGEGPASSHLSGRKVMEWSPLALGVHRAIQVPGGVQDELPGFVLRTHDHMLRAEVASAVEGPKLIMLVGGSSTGKTRSAVEAVRSMLPDWHLLYPLTVSELVSLIEERRVGGQTILWLNETQVYLDGDGRADAAAALRRLLAGRQSLLVIGTLWPEYWLTYTRPPEFGAPDPYLQARQLLEAAVKIDVPDRFTESDTLRTQVLAVRDPRLAAALGAASGHGVTQVLAGGPDLIDRWRNSPNPYCRAVITAAIDARRLGHLSVLSADVLRASAAVYLDGPQRAAAPADWFDEALAFARQPVKGAIAPLTATAQTVGKIDGYLLADYLDQHGRALRRRHPVPDSLWAALASHTPVGADLSRLGTAAAERGRYQYAVILWTAASKAGDVSMSMSLSRLLSSAGHHNEAELALRRAAEAGNQEGFARLLAILQREERHDELEHFLRRAASAGQHQAAHHLAVLLSKVGRVSEAIQVLRQAIAGGDQHGEHLLSLLLKRTQVPEYTATTEQSPGSQVTTSVIDGRPGDGLQAVDPNGTAERARRGSRTGRAPGGRKATPRLRNLKISATSRPSGNVSPPSGTTVDRGEGPDARSVSGTEPASGTARTGPIADGASSRVTQTQAEYRRRSQVQREESLRAGMRAGDVDAERAFAVFLIATDKISEGERILRAAVSGAGDTASLRLLTEVLGQTGREHEASMLARYGLAEDGTTSSAW